METWCGLTWSPVREMPSRWEERMVIRRGEVLTGIVTLKLIMFNADGIDSYTRDADGGFYSYEIDEETLEEKEKVSLNDRVTELGTITFDTGR